MVGDVGIGIGVFGVISLKLIIHRRVSLYKYPTSVPHLIVHKIESGQTVAETGDTARNNDSDKTRVGGDDDPRCAEAHFRRGKAWNDPTTDHKGVPLSAVCH